MRGQSLIAGALIASAAVLCLPDRAQAAPGDPFTPQPSTWCPGQMGPFGYENLLWDNTVCHVWWPVPKSMGNVMALDRDGNVMNIGILADAPQPTVTPPPPPPPLPPHPFCSPRGALIIIPPICDEIGVDIPTGSVHN